MRKFCELSGEESMLEVLQLVSASKEFNEVALRTAEKKILNSLNSGKAGHEYITDQCARICIVRKITPNIFIYISVLDIQYCRSVGNALLLALVLPICQRNSYPFYIVTYSMK